MIYLVPFPGGISATMKDIKIFIKSNIKRVEGNILGIFFYCKILGYFPVKLINVSARLVWWVWRIVSWYGYTWGCWSLGSCSWPFSINPSIPIWNVSPTTGSYSPICVVIWFPDARRLRSIFHSSKESLFRGNPHGRGRQGGNCGNYPHSPFHFPGNKYEMKIVTCPDQMVRK